MNRRTVAAAVLVLVGVFAALSVSVVSTHRSLDSRVSDSFDAAASKRADGLARAKPLGCTKQRLYFYGCSEDVRLRRGSAPVTLNWRLWVRDDGCWSVTPMRSFPAGSARPALSALPTPEGCAAR